MIYHINIGSNQGDREAIIADAVALIALISETEPRISRYYESEPWGFESENRFLNIGVEIEYGAEPSQLLSELQRIERELGATPHRDSSGSYLDRNLDIDIICAIDKEMIVETPLLTIPHPRMSERLFVLEPLHELSPEWIHPITKQNVDNLIKNNTDG